MTDSFDILVIGAGPGGHAAALEAARRGIRAAVIEKQGWGGTCTHRGCIPTKALLACSRRFAELKKIRRLGINVGEFSFDYPAMKRHRDQIVKISALGVEKSLKDAGVQMLAAEGTIIAPGQVELRSPQGDVRRLKARDIVIAWGSQPALPPGVRLSERILTSDGFLSLPTLPASVLIVGGNVIGVEFATLLAELGVPVTLVEMLERLLPGEEPEASALLTQELRKMGAEIHTGVRMETIQERGDRAELLVLPATPLPSEKAPADRTGGASSGIKPVSPGEFAAGCALIATGRKPSLRQEELDALGIRYDRRGVIVNQQGRTNIPGIYAVGDVTGGIMLAHRAMQQGKALAGFLCGDPSIDYREEAVPAVAYAHPQIARVGLTEEAALNQGFSVEIHRADFAANIIARAHLAGPGFVKLIFAGEKLLGATVAGEEAGELIAPLGLAIAAGLTRRQLRNWIIPHPTLSEVLSL